MVILFQISLLLIWLHKELTVQESPLFAIKDERTKLVTILNSHSRFHLHIAH